MVENTLQNVVNFKEQFQTLLQNEENENPDIKEC